MDLADPVKIYAAASTIEARMIGELLQGAGIEAYAGAEDSAGGVFTGGALPGVSDAGVFVSRADADRALEVIRQHEQVEIGRANAVGDDVEATCEDCGKTSTFPAAQRGSVQDCPHCGGLIDVGEVELPGGWGDDEKEEDAPG